VKQASSASPTKEMIKDALGAEFDPEADYVLTTPKAVSSHKKSGKVELARFEARLGETLVVMGDQPQSGGKRS
jgi:hypothetical protein